MLADELCLGCMSPLSGQKTCPRCGYSPAGGYDPAYLAPGTQLIKGRYTVGKLVRKNGEGATYIGFDSKADEACWIREYFPTTLARRDPATGAITALEGMEAQFKSLIADFVDVSNEVKRLGVTENVIPIRDVIAENRTVYVIYEKKDVVSYEEYLAENGGKLPLAKALDTLLPLCNMIGTIHDRGYIHRGISPQTVFVDEEGALYLGDFSLGATRTGGSELKAELFNGYTAPEQYVTNGWQGAWTDVYALAAMFYRTLSGFVPPKSTLVGGDRPLATLDDLVMDIPHNVSEAVRSAMASSTDSRTQTVYDFVAKLIETETTNTAIYDTNRTKKQVQRQKSAQHGNFKYALIALFFTVAVLGGGMWLIVTTYLPMPSSESSSGASRSDSSELPESTEIASSSEPAPAATPQVPRFVGEMLADVQSNEEYTAHFDFKVETEYSDDFPEGTIMRQSPDGGTLMPNRGTVILYVSKGPELAIVPEIVGLKWEDAEKILNDNSIPYKMTERYKAGAEEGTVIGTVPAQGEEFNPKQDTVTVEVMPKEDVTQASSPGDRGRPESVDEEGFRIP